MTSWWPLFDLRLTTPRLSLRHVREADLPVLIAGLPDDLELDPSLPSLNLADPDADRGTWACREYWRSLGLWRPDEWCLRLLVELNGRVAGVQTLEGSDFPELRTVDTASYLQPWARGRGVGKEMRAAVLALAFGPLRADWAVTSAWADNHASLGVSRALGYRDNGVSLLAYQGRVGTQVHLRLEREDWLAGGLGADVEIRGFDACRPWFGVPLADRDGVGS